MKAVIFQHMDDSQKLYALLCQSSLGVFCDEPILLFEIFKPALHLIFGIPVFFHEKVLDFIPFPFIELYGGCFVIVFQEQFSKAFCNHFNCHRRCPLSFLMVTE